MRMFALRLLFVLLCGLPVYTIVTDALSASHRSQNPSTTTPIPKPFFFTENKGQWDARVLYKCQAKNGMTWFLERDGITLLVSREQGTGNREPGRGGFPRPPDDPVRRTFLSDDYSSRVRPSGSPVGDAVRRTFLSDDPYERDLPEMLRRHPQKKYPMKSHALKFHFVKGEGSKVNGEGSKVKGARSAKEDSENLDQSSSTQHPTPYTLNPSPDFLHPTPYTLHQSFSTLHRASAQSVEAQGELPWKNNYFLGNDTSKWAPNCRNFSTVIYREVWDGIDIEWYENDGKLEFDFIVHPGFDPSQIRMSVEGLEGDRISGFGAQETGLSLRGSAATKQSHLVNGNREPETGNSRGVPRTPAEIVRDLLRDSRTTGGTTSRTPSPESRATVPCSRLPVPELLLPTSLGELRTALPSVYQVSANGTRNEIEAAFQLTDKNIFGITLPNGYNPDHSLRIDPLIYSTALGGSENDYAYGIASDGQGGVYLIGNTESFDFPITAGCYDPSISGGFDIFVTQLNNNGSQLIFSTYLGGFGDECYGAIITDGSFGLIVSGQTNSANFPTTTGVYSRTYNGGPDEYFIAKLDNSGSALLFGTYLGGHHISGCPQLISDGAGGCFVIGSANSDFPSTPNAYDPTFNGGTNDGFFAQLNGNGTQLLYSTFFGGSRNDYCSDFIREANGDFVITGTTNSSDFPVTPNAFDTTYNGHGTGNIGDCFVLKFRLSESRLIYSSYLGGHDEDYESSLTSDNRGGVIVGGRTFSANYPTTANAFDTSKVDEVDDGFVTRLDNTGSQLIYSTFIGGTPNHIGAGSSCYQITNDGNGGALVFGSTASSDFPTTSNAFNFSFNGGFDDCFLSYLDSTGSRLLYSTYLGGGGSDQPRGDIIRDSSGAVILFGDTYQSAGYYNNFPRTSGAFDTSFNIWSDCFIAKLRFDTTSVTIEPTSIPTAFTLHQNYPNPFNSSTTISYSLPKPGNVDVRLFDITGREVATLVNQKQQTGSNRVTFDGKKLSSGTYFVRMQAGEFIKTQKMVLLK